MTHARIKDWLCQRSEQEMSTASQFFSVSTTYLVRSSLLRWRQVLSRFYPRIQQSNKNTGKQRAVNSLQNPLRWGTPMFKLYGYVPL